MKDQPICQSGPAWLKEVAKVHFTKIGRSEPDKHVLAPLTGQDYRAYKTFLHALDLYCYTDSREDALFCMKHAVNSMQPQTRWIARATIPHLMDWGDQITLWQQILAVNSDKRAVGGA